MPKLTTLFWWDNEHFMAMRGFSNYLNKNGWWVRLYTDPPGILGEPAAEDALVSRVGTYDAFLLHCGRLDQPDRLTDFLQRVRTEFPKVKIGIQSEARVPGWESIVDFYIPMAGQTPERMLRMLNKAVAVQDT